MNAEASFRAFLGWIIAGMGLHIGWGLISLIVDMAAKALGR